MLLARKEGPFSRVGIIDVDLGELTEVDLGDLTEGAIDTANVGNMPKVTRQRH
jgi:hypothetical protein